MASAEILEHGQITIPKQIRERLGLKKGDVVEARIEVNCVVIMPKKSTTPENWAKLLNVWSHI